ncbi:Uma2 family endonuclease [Plasticicumulans sp.]|uniref:Uma2 family endonuclease n=1 Tax=Plasticicumulans sp. TaxID=2307179 RepID=UPI002C55B02E|nr:Uma2 family endonuclease [Plasticicumulans sp.]HNM44484.1 Uma2 family endonuclease [Plasticicumulans sp.]
MSRPLPARDEVWSAEDYLGWPSDTPRCELIDGRVYAMSPAPTLDHQQIALTFASELRISLRSRRGQDGGGGNCSCQVFIAPTDVRLDAHTVVQPDVLVVCDPAKLANGRHVDGAPDLVVEVLSPSNALKDRRLKRRVYERAGVPELLLIDPEQRYVEIHRLGSDGRYAAPELIAPQEPLPLALLPDWQPTPGELFGWPPADLSLDEDMPAAP